VSTPIASAYCGPYEIVAQRDASLRECDDRSLVVIAEASYLVRLGEEADRQVLKGALSVPLGGKEGILRFGNFVGEARLGGRRLVVRSDRLAEAAVDRMLAEVAGALPSLPFGAASPTSAPYTRDRVLGPDPLYHAFIFIRDGMQARGPHDVPGAVERILARAHESLRTEDPRLIPVGHASRIDAATLGALQSEPELMEQLAAGSPLAAHPLARRLGGLMPGLIRVRRLGHTTDNPENRFVLAVLLAMTDIARQFERLALRDNAVAATMNAREAAVIASRLERWRRHPVLESLRAAPELPVQSTVLRGRPGYRELLRFYMELLDRSRLTEPHLMRPLLELRDAALIYEYWCYFQVVAAVTECLGTSMRVDRFAVSPLGSRVPFGYRAAALGVEVVYNYTYSSPAESYSVPLRPDITLRTSGGRLHLFDAKLKVEFDRAVTSDDPDDSEETLDTFKREDLYKMHAYRDALGADSVWALYPGSQGAPSAYRAPADNHDVPGRFRGVGAIALRPGAMHDGGLRARIEEILKQTS